MAVVLDDVLPCDAVKAVEAAVPLGPRVVQADLRPGGWARSIEDAIRARFDRLAAPFPLARRRIGQSLRVDGGSAVWTEAGAAPVGWHVDPVAPSALWVFWYGGEFEGGALETEAGCFVVRRNSLLAFCPNERHRVRQVTRGARLAIQFVLLRWR